MNFKFIEFLSKISIIIAILMLLIISYYDLLFGMILITIMFMITMYLRSKMIGN